MSARGGLGARLAWLHERWVRLVYAPVLYVVVAMLVRLATRRGEASGRGLARLARRALEPGDCCEPGSPDSLLGARFRAIVAELADPRRFRALLAEGRARATRRWLVAVGVASLLHEARQWVLRLLRRRLGAPVVVLSEAQLAVAPDCELACGGCFARPGHGGREPTTASVLAAVDAAASLGATAIHLIGKGEPLVPASRGVAVARAIAARPHLVFTIATGAPELDDAVLDALARAPNALVLASVEGPAALHDARRGAGSHARTRLLLERLRERGIAFGTSTMVARTTREAIAERAFVDDLAATGALVAVFVRYFPLAPDRAAALTLREEDVAAWRASLATLRKGAPLPLVDLDELEEASGCRSRAGVSIHLDATTGEVSPCLRVPFAPAGAPTLDAAPLDAILRHPFFAAYRARAADRRHTCGDGLARELRDVEADLAAAGCDPGALPAYRRRADGRRALPLVRTGDLPRHEDVPELPAAE